MGLLREMVRRCLVSYHQPRHWQLRPNTLDRRLFRQVVLQNEYRLPARLDTEDVILDIGGHIGSFALAVLRRGIGKVVCCEPDPANFRLLQHNLAPWGPRVECLQAAVWSEQPTQRLSVHNCLDPRNTGASQLCLAQHGEEVSVVVFDELVEQWTQQRPLRLVKLDCEGAEWPILLTSKRLDRVTGLCGEYHLGPLPEFFQLPGSPPFSVELLVAHLNDHGFEVQLHHQAQAAIPSGLFFAQRRRQK